MYWPRGGVSSKKFVRGCSNYSLKFRPPLYLEKHDFVTHIYTIFLQKALNLRQIGCFLAKFSKLHPILQIRRIGYVTIIHPSIYQNLRKCTSKPLSIPVNHLSVRTPPRGYWPQMVTLPYLGTGGVGRCAYFLRT